MYAEFVLHAEFVGVMLAIEIAFDKGWHNLWIECDSKLVLDAFKNISLVPWKLVNRWKNCLYIADRMNIRFSHIFREGNSSADKLAAYGTTIQGLHWWNLIPRYGLPSFRVR